MSALALKVEAMHSRRAPASIFVNFLLKREICELDEVCFVVIQGREPQNVQSRFVVGREEMASRVSSAGYVF
jgi:hypothetical protein